MGGFASAPVAERDMLFTQVKFVASGLPGALDLVEQRIGIFQG